MIINWLREQPVDAQVCIVLAISDPTNKYFKHISPEQENATQTIQDEATHGIRSEPAAPITGRFVSQVPT